MGAKQVVTHTTPQGKPRVVETTGKGLLPLSGRHESAYTSETGMQPGKNYTTWGWLHRTL